MPKDRKQAAKNGTKGASTTTTTTTTNSATAAAQLQQQSPPQWPVFKPPLPVSDLALETVVPGKVVVVPGFFPRSLCAAYVAFLRTLPLVTTPARPRKGDAVRQNDRFQVHDPDFAARLWLQTGLRRALLEGRDESEWGGKVIGLSPNIRVYRYSKGQHFAPHYDDSNNLTLESPDPQETGGRTTLPVKTTWTLLLYLTGAAAGECAGGETVFYPNDRVSRKDEVAVAPQAGLLLLHKHGDDCMLHEGREVTSGEKWVIRSDLCVAK